MRRLTLLLVLAALVVPASAQATPVATSDSQYSQLGRVFPDPLAGCQGAACSPNAQGNVPAVQFIQYTELVDALKYMNQKSPWSRYMEVWPLDGKLGDGSGSGLGGDAFPGNNLKRLEFKPNAKYQSAGIPTTDIGRKKSDLMVVRVTDESVPDAGKKRYALSLSIHGIERAGVEGGTRAIEDLVSASTTGKSGSPIIPRQVDSRAPSIADVLRHTIIYFTYPNPDGWRRGSVSEGGVFFQRYNGNGVDVNRDWPDIGFSFRRYSGLSEPESRGFAAFYDDVRSQTKTPFTAGDDLHGQLEADALSFTLLPHGKHDFNKDLRIRDTAIAIHNNSERALSWSPIIQPNSAPQGGGLPCAPPAVAPGDTCVRIYGQTWGTVYDTINYTTTGALGDYFDSSLGLGADGIDNEMSFSHLDKNIVFEPQTEQLHVDGNKALIYAHLAQLSHPPNRAMGLPGREGYVPNTRLRRKETSYQPGAPPGTKPQADIQGQLGTPDPDGVAFPFEVQRSSSVYNGGMRVEITKESLQGISEAVAALKVQCKGCDEHPGVKDSGEWVTVAEDFNQSPLYLQAGLTVAVNRPQAYDKKGGKVQWRALLDTPAVARMNVDFSSGAATTDGTTGGGTSPRLAGYDIANTDFFKGLNGFIDSPAQRFGAVDPHKVAAGRQSLSGLESLVLADNALPGSYSTNERAKWFSALRKYVEGGGNLVLTDAALRALPEFVKIAPQNIQRTSVYVGQVSFAETAGGDTTKDPLAKNVRQPGARFNGGEEQKRRQTFEPTPLGFSIQDAQTGTDQSHARQYHVDKGAFKAAGGRVVATSATSDPDASTADFGHVTVGEFKRGKGTIRVAGALLPQPTEEFDHPLGLEPFALTYTGYTLFCNLVDCVVRNSSLTSCIRSVGKISGTRLGPAVLSRTRKRQRRTIGARLRSGRGGIDRYCVTGGGAVRIGYPTKRLNRGVGRRLRRNIRSRAQLALTSSRRVSLKRVKVGSSTRTLRRRLRGERRYRVGRNVWYVVRGKRARLLFQVRRGRVTQIGIASKRLSRTRRSTRRLLRAWQL